MIYYCAEKTFYPTTNHVEVDIYPVENKIKPSYKSIKGLWNISFTYFETEEEAKNYKWESIKGLNKYED